MEIDARNVTCPKPVVMTLEALAKLPAGESLKVTVNDSVALGNLTRLAQGKGIDLEVQKSGDESVLTFTPGENATASLEDIKELEARGTEILTCGTCLDFYGLREKLAVGGVTNLYAIAQILSSNPGVSVL